jgi:hypothetical protein
MVADAAWFAAWFANELASAQAHISRAAASTAATAPVSFMMSPPESATRLQRSRRRRASFT